MRLTLALAQIWIACLVLSFLLAGRFGSEPTIFSFGVILIPPLAIVVFILEMLGAFKALSDL